MAPASGRTGARTLPKRVPVKRAGAGTSARGPQAKRRAGFLVRPAGARTVDAYLAQVEPAARKALSAVRAEILKAAPEAEERISYQIPSYYLNGPLVHFAAQPKHLSLYGVSLVALEKLGREHPGLKIVGRTIHFSPGSPLPPGLVGRLVKARVKENASLA